MPIVHVVIAFALVGLIVIQRGKETEAGAAPGVERRMPVVNKVSYATSGNGYLAKTEYEKLKREVQALKNQMQRLLEALSTGPAPKPATEAAPVTAESKPAAAAAKGQKKTVSSAPPLPKETVAPADQEEFGAEKGDRRKEAGEAKRELDQFLRAQKLLFKPGEVQFEFGAFYARDSSAVPVFPVPKSRLASANFLMRYGLAEELEFDFAVPLVYTELKGDAGPFDQVTVRETTVRNTRKAGVGLGDIEWGLRYAALHERGAIPEVTLNVNAKSDTGDVDRLLGAGHWYVGTGVSLVKTIDPVVFFGSLGYTWTLEEQDVDPGDQIPYSIGMGFSLNDRVSLSMAMGGAAIRRTEVKGGEISGSGRDINSLQFSTTVQLAKRLYLEPVVGFGLTDDAADFMVGINVPFGLEGRFPLPFLNNL
ncbi:MAG: transporter [Gammaproteobacteria bacterium]